MEKIMSEEKKAARMQFGYLTFVIITMFALLIMFLLSMFGQDDLTKYETVTNQIIPQEKIISALNCRSDLTEAPFYLVETEKSNYFLVSYSNENFSRAQFNLCLIIREIEGIQDIGQINFANQAKIPDEDCGLYWVAYRFKNFEYARFKSNDYGSVLRKTNWRSPIPKRTRN